MRRLAIAILLAMTACAGSAPNADPRLTFARRILSADAPFSAVAQRWLPSGQNAESIEPGLKAALIAYKATVQGLTPPQALVADHQHLLTGIDLYEQTLSAFEQRVTERMECTRRGGVGRPVSCASDFRIRVGLLDERIMSANLMIVDVADHLREIIDKASGRPNA